MTLILGKLLYSSLNMLGCFLQRMSFSFLVPSCCLLVFFRGSPALVMKRGVNHRFSHTLQADSQRSLVHLSCCCRCLEGLATVPPCVHLCFGSRSLMLSLLLPQQVAPTSDWSLEYLCCHDNTCCFLLRQNGCQKGWASGAFSHWLGILGGLHLHVLSEGVGPGSESQCFQISGFG